MHLVLRRVLTLAVPTLLLGSLLVVPASATPALSCYNLDCPTPHDTPYYQGGPVVTHPTLYLVRFSTSATRLVPSTGYVPRTFAPTQPNVTGALNQLLSPSVAGWWMSLYSPNAAGAMHPGRVHGTITVYDPALAMSHNVSDPQIMAELTRLDTARLLPGNLRNDIFVLFFRANQKIYVPGLGTSAATYCAYHSAASSTSGGEINYVVVPNEAAVSGCAFGGANNAGLDAFAAMTVHLSHELAETITDPSEQLAWASPRGDEIADVCQPSSNAIFPGYQATGLGVDYYFQLLYARRLKGCFGQNVATSLNYTPTDAGPLPVSLGMNIYGVASGQPINLYVNGTIIASAVTNTESSATFTLPLESPGTEVTLSYPGNGPLDTVSSTYLVPSPTTNTPVEVLSATMASSSVGGYSPAISITDTNASPEESLLVSYDHESRPVSLYSDDTAATTVSTPKGTTLYRVTTSEPAGENLALTLSSKVR